jgi:(2Fe-2S) ferredoxin
VCNTPAGSPRTPAKNPWPSSGPLAGAMEPVVRKFRSFEEAEKADQVYYANLTPEQRLEIFAEILRRGRGPDDGSTQRLARVFRIVKLPRG